MGAEHERPMEVGRTFKRRAPLLAWSLGLVVLAGLVYWQTDDPRVPHTSALNAVFDARWLVAGARLLVGVTVVYLLLSIGVRVRNRQWVRSAGPVITDAGPAQAIAEDQEDLQQQLSEAKATIDDLTVRLDRSLEARQALLGTMDEPRNSGQDEVPGQGSERHA
jgi:hypothetical protein